MPGGTSSQSIPPNNKPHMVISHFSRINVCNLLYHVHMYCSRAVLVCVLCTYVLQQVSTGEYHVLTYCSRSVLQVVVAWRWNMYCFDSTVLWVIDLVSFYDTLSRLTSGDTREIGHTDIRPAIWSAKDFVAERSAVRSANSYLFRYVTCHVSRVMQRVPVTGN